MYIFCCKNNVFRVKSSMKDTIQNLRGFPDFSIEEGNQIGFILSKLLKIGKSFGFNFIVPPILEPIELFQRGLGDTDIVNKEMFIFPYKERKVCLRPETTASVVKYCINNNVHRGKFMYFSQNFRKERPQKGRYRQFNQFGFEIIGIPSPFREIETFFFINQFFKSLGLNYILKINSIGSIKTRTAYVNDLEKYFKTALEKDENALCQDSKNRLERKSILRILDSKALEDKQTILEAPKILSYLEKDSAEIFKEVVDFLQKQSIPFEVEETLVRGLDYYNDIVFEIKCDRYNAAQDSLGGGGAYDSLFETLGSPKTNAFGMALGVDRLILNEWPMESCALDAYVVLAEPYFDILSEVLSSKKYRVIDYFVNIPKALEKAIKNKINFLIIIGDEISTGHIIVKNLEKKDQQKVKIGTFKDL